MLLYFLHFSLDKNGIKKKSRKLYYSFLNVTTCIYVLRYQHNHWLRWISSLYPKVFLSFFGSKENFPCHEIMKAIYFIARCFLRRTFNSTQKKVLTTTTSKMNVRRFQKNDFYDFKALFMKWTHFKSLSSTLYNLKDSKWVEMKRQNCRKNLEFHVRDTRRH